MHVDTNNLLNLAVFDDISSCVVRWGGLSDSHKWYYTPKDYFTFKSNSNTSSWTVYKHIRSTNVPSLVNLGYITMGEDIYLDL